MSLGKVFSSPAKDGRLGFSYLYFGLFGDGDRIWCYPVVDTALRKMLCGRRGPEAEDIGLGVGTAAERDGGPKLKMMACV